MQYKRTNSAVIVTLEKGEVLDGGTLADFQWEASKYGVPCIINNEDCSYHPKKTALDYERDYNERHSIMGEIPSMHQYDALDCYFDEKSF